VPRARKALPPPTWLVCGFAPPPDGYPPLAKAIIWDLEPFIDRRRPALLDLWAKIVERKADGSFVNEVEGFGVGSILDPMKRQETAFWMILHEAAWLAREPIYTVEGKWDEFPGAAVAVPRVRTRKVLADDGGRGRIRAVKGPRDRNREHARAVCACLLAQSERIWGAMRLKVAWRLTLLATGIPERRFTVDAAEALADMIKRARRDRSKTPSSTPVVPG
jgi:hypothetical protein